MVRAYYAFSALFMAALVVGITFFLILESANPEVVSLSMATLEVIMAVIGYRWGRRVAAINRRSQVDRSEGHRREVLAGGGAVLGVGLGFMLTEFVTIDNAIAAILAVLISGAVGVVLYRAVHPEMDSEA